MCVANVFSGVYEAFLDSVGTTYHLISSLYLPKKGGTTLATIRGRKRADGTMSYTARIRIKKNGAQVYTQSQTFARKKAAEAWAKRRETELSEPGALVRAKTPKAQLKDVIAQYFAEVGKAQQLGFVRKVLPHATQAAGQCDHG